MKACKLLLVAALLTLAACTDRAAVLPDGTSVVEGKVVYEGLGAVPEGDVVEVMLVNVSDPEVRYPVATDRIDDPGEPPVDFDIVYQVQGLQPGNAYAVCARALDASGDTLWHSARPEPVQLPSDDPVIVEVTFEDYRWVECGDWD